MSNEIVNLEPKLLWESFYKLTQIPRPSKKELKAAGAVAEFGRSLGLETIQDEIGNVIIRKPATPGMENRKGIILQGHIDMVPQKNSDKVHDFEKDPIDAYVEDGWVTAKGTTLGADNGIGVAASMAVLQSDDIVHGPLEVLVTIDEETGMTGANELKPGLLKGDILINMDSEDEGQLFVGCAGGTNANIRFSFKEYPFPSHNSLAYKLSVTSLKGGHSGLDINIGRANANKLVFRFLKYAVSKLGVRLSSVDGGSLRNAIPRDAFAVISVPKEKNEQFMEAVKEYEAVYKNEYSSTEPFLQMDAEVVDNPDFVMNEVVQDDLINAIQACPNGVIRMSADMEGLVETSTNLAIIKSDKDSVAIQCLIRSSVDTAKDDLESVHESLFRLAGAEILFDGRYPGWKPNLDSAILKTMQNVYQDKWGVIPQINGIHAGLECGILGNAYPNWDMISFGPTIRYPHSPDEKVNIETVQKFWDFLVETLKNTPNK